MGQGYSQSEGIDYEESLLLLLTITPLDHCLIPMISLSNNVEMLKREKAAIGNRFQVEDLGEIHHVLGMTVKLNRRL